MLTIHFQAVNYKADVKLKEYASKRLNKLSLFHNRILEILIFLTSTISPGVMHRHSNYLDDDKR